MGERKNLEGEGGGCGARGEENGEGVEGWSGAERGKMCMFIVGRRVALHKKTAVASPWVWLRGSEGRDEQAGYLDEDGDGEEESTVVVKAVGERCDDKNGNKVHLRRVNWFELAEDSLWAHLQSRWGLSVVTSPPRSGSG